MAAKVIYKTLRSIIFSVTLVIVGLYVLGYILVSIPAFTNMVKNRTAMELSNLLGGEVTINSLDIYPFNEAIVRGISLYEPNGRKCIEINTVGAGISLWKLVYERRIEISYGEIIGLNANIVQRQKDGSLNISFIIDALTSKDDKKEKKHFELALKNVVLRKSAIAFRRPWLENATIGDVDLSDLEIKNLAADITFPKISDNETEIDLRRLSFAFGNFFNIKKFAFAGKVSKDEIGVKNFVLETNKSRIFIPEIELELKGKGGFADLLEKEPHAIEITRSFITPSDFSFLYSPLSSFSEALPLEIMAQGTLNEVSIDKFSFGQPELLLLTFTGKAEGLRQPDKITGEIEALCLNVNPIVFNRLEESLQKMPPVVRHSLQKSGGLDLNAVLSADLAQGLLGGQIDLTTRLFKIMADGKVDGLGGKEIRPEGEVNITDLNLNEIFPAIPVSSIDSDIIFAGSIANGNPEGDIGVVVENFDFKNRNYDGFTLNLNKSQGEVKGDLMMHNQIADIETEFEGEIESETKTISLAMNLSRLDFSQIIDVKGYKDYIIYGNLKVEGSGSGIDDMTGELDLDKFSFESPDGKRKLKLNNLTLAASSEDSVRSVNLKSDWIDARMDGKFLFKDVAGTLHRMVSDILPNLIMEPKAQQDYGLAEMDFDVILKNNNILSEFLNLPIKLLVPLNISGFVSGNENKAGLTMDLPYLQQGKDKLIYDTRFNLALDGNSATMDALLETNLPVKKGDLNLNLNLFGKNNAVTTDIHWKNTENSTFNGRFAFDTHILREDLSRNPSFQINILPSLLQMGTADWTVSPADITYSDKTVTIDNLKIGNMEQYVEIAGIASSEYSDILKISLADIDVDYVFDMLQINYVTFGGTATGEVAGRGLLGSDPVAETESFVIKEFTYNGADLGTCVATSKWNNEEKEIEITADISMDGRRIVYGNGGIWLGQDSLCFEISADKVPVDFVQPFMAVFSSHVGGYATGDVKLFGNFHDIDMTGRIFADSVAIKLDYTNTLYHGSDSVYLNPGQILIPHFELYDKYGNTAMVTGELTHRFFHDPSFTFRLSDARNFLCYDISSEINPDWYGTLFGTGSALLEGVPGQVDINADMTITGNSTFTFVLNETMYAQDYQFLTFSDRRKEERELLMQTEVDFKELFKKRMTENQESLSRFGIDIRATVTPDVLFTLVMDPAAGDKITAKGKGAMQVKYQSDNDDMAMYGKYEIEEGNYNFSLQDIILRDFKIKEGSYISFNGNPLGADLDISATYRVNTNLSDLDKSFSTDRDLNRTNVPVDAVLTVTGDMQSPTITFDIELPTLTQDVERKVKSIISTDDMMNRQIIYLLALNRFYTPEYMGSTGNGGELAAVASSTISSQLSNILGQLTDKFSVSPSFRSDKGDFSDIEVDVALSSRLLNNRLLINGNFGYRDRSASSTTFVGDFDVEYLLSKNGNIRLKAYNHFNDQNYYLREALTTQGLGIVYRRDFDDWFTFLKKRRKINAVNNITSTDTSTEKTEETSEGNGTEN